VDGNGVTPSPKAANGCKTKEKKADYFVPERSGRLDNCRENVLGKLAPVADRFLLFPHIFHGNKAAEDLLVQYCGVS
jgi:hypothetical protein